jgi:hypothetical protein
MHVRLSFTFQCSLLESSTARTFHPHAGQHGGLQQEMHPQYAAALIEHSTHVSPSKAALFSWFYLNLFRIALFTTDQAHSGESERPVSHDVEARSDSL